MINAVRLLDAETPFMQKSGARRIRRLAATGLAGNELLHESAPAKLLALLHPGTDRGNFFLCACRVKRWCSCGQWGAVGGA